MVPPCFHGNGHSMSDETRADLLRQFEAHEKFAKRVEKREAKGKDTHDEVWEYPLSVEHVAHVVITLGVGGPHTELDVELDSGYSVRSVTWHGYWGGEHVERKVFPGDPLHELAERYTDVIADDLRYNLGER